MENRFKALADASRLRIVNLLLEGELCVCDIQHVLGMSQPNVSRHLSYLKHSGMAADRREGNRIFYRLEGEQPGGNNRDKRELFKFLRTAFLRDESLRGDLDRLREAVRKGACSVIRPRKSF